MNMYILRQGRSKETILYQDNTRLKVQSLCFPYLNIHCALPVRIEDCTTEKSKRRLPICTCKYKYIKYLFIRLIRGINHSLLTTNKYYMTFRNAIDFGCDQFKVKVHSQVLHFDSRETNQGLTLEMPARENLQGDQFTSSTQLIKRNYLVMLYKDAVSQILQKLNVFIPLTFRLPVEQMSFLGNPGFSYF